MSTYILSCHSSTLCLLILREFGCDNNVQSDHLVRVLEEINLKLETNPAFKVCIMFKYMGWEKWKKKYIYIYEFRCHTPSSRPGVFNLSDSAGHINNFNDARGPQSYTRRTCTHNWEKWPERQSEHKPLYNVQTTSGARVCSYFFKTAGGPRVEDPWSRPTEQCDQ
jgi:hypothetical protein